MLLCRSQAKVLVLAEVPKTSELDSTIASQYTFVLTILRLTPSTPLAKSVSLGASDSLKVLLTTVDGKTAKRPHQAFLTLTDPTTGLEESFVFNVKDSGKGKVDLVCSQVNASRAKLISAVSERPPPSVPYLLEANHRLNCHWVIWLLHTLQEQGIRPASVPRPQRPPHRSRGAPSLRSRA
jgi:hypothetical protein